MVLLEKTNEYTNIWQTTEKSVDRFVIEETVNNSTIAILNFQSGAIKEVGVNGIFNEDLLRIIETRLERFQETEYICLENEIALDSVRVALEALTDRTARRKLEGVEGTHEV